MVPYESKLRDPWSSHTRIVELVGPGTGGMLLDVGSAEGDLAVALRESGWIVTCLEADPHRAAVARARGFPVTETDVSLPFPEPVGPFDTIVLGDVLEHLSDPEAALRVLLGRLAPGGRMVISVPNVAFLWIRACLLVGRFEYAERGILDRTHLRFFTLASFRRLLRGAGLRTERLVATPAPLHLAIPGQAEARWLRMAQACGALLARAWKGLFAYQFVVSCQRGS